MFFLNLTIVNPAFIVATDTPNDHIYALMLES